jgi:branched-chain amino acid aminotransferase
MKVWINGKLVDRARAKLTVFDHGTLYGDGVFEGIRVYDGRIFQCRAHVDRLFNSADRIRLKIPYSQQELIDAMHETVRANGLTNGYIRLVVTRGEGTLGLSPFKCPRPNAFIIADTIELYPQEMYEKGMPVIIARTVRCSAHMLDPRIKSLNYLNNICAKIECIDAGVPEAIMLNTAGNVAECTGDNIFIVKDGRIATPPEDAGILLGITRAVVIRLAGRMGLPLREMDLTVGDLYAADECFLTGTAAEVIAVTRVDGRAVGDGSVGPVTRKLLAAFKEFVHSDEAEGEG